MTSRKKSEEEKNGNSITFEMIFSVLVKKIRLKYLIPAVIFGVILIDQTGMLLHISEKDFHTEFQYPMKGDIRILMEQLRMGKELDQVPINEHNYVIRTWSKAKCADEKTGEFRKDLRLVYIVKSAIENFSQRQTIRRTWGYEKRFSDVNIRTVFLLGTHQESSDKREEDELQKRINDEYKQYGDIVQGNFIDTYYNNTIKTMMGLRWASEACPKSRFYAFVDDDYYVSTRNMLRFLRNPVNYPSYLEDPVISFDDIPLETHRGPDGRRKLQQVIDFDLPDDAVLYAGYVHFSPPHRHKPSKWFITLDEYPFHLFPPYVTAGSYVLSQPAMKDFYYASYFVKRFRFDDVFLGLVAKKLDVEPFHSPEFHFYKHPYNSVNSYRYVVASHGYSDPNELERIWNRQKELGNA